MDVPFGVRHPHYTYNIIKLYIFHFENIILTVQEGHPWKPAGQGRPTRPQTHALRSSRSCGKTSAMQDALFSGDPETFPAIDRQALNEAQYAAVTHGTGPLLVIAGAGSGKTRTLVYRVAFLMRQGVPPESILLLTFTRRAAQEMLLRASRLTDQSCQRVMGGTFHATANILLRQYGHHIGIPSRFSIIDRSDAEGIINLLRSSMDLSGAGRRFPSKRTIMNLISGSINKAKSIEELIFSHSIHLSEFQEDILGIQRHYNQFKQDHGLMDYDDLLINWQRLLQESVEAREAVSNRFRYILVDEYQDTNPIQADIIRLLAYGHDNIMVVGDDAQSIYSFRGADFYNIMRFPEQFPGTAIVKLEENYRSTQPILALANSIIASAREKFTKTLYSSLESDRRPILFSARSEAGEARYVADRIEALLREGTELHEMAVLFRSGFHSYKLELELNSRGIGFEKRGGLKLTESAHIKDVLAFLRIVVNPWDTLSWNRILLQLDKVGPKTAQKIVMVIQEHDDPLEALRRYRPGRGWQEGFTRLVNGLEQIYRDDQSPEQRFDRVMEYYEPLFEKIYHDDYPRRRKDLDQVRTLVSGYGDLQSFIDDTVLEPPEAGSGIMEPDSGRLILSTIHSAKGLEWDAVFIIGLADGRFPNQYTSGDEHQYEEERRLLYVAATRARKQLFLTYPRQLVTAERQVRQTVMCPFLREINPGLYIREEERPDPSSFHRAPGLPASGNVSGRSAGKGSVRSARIDFSPGMLVLHDFFGPGRVISVPGPRRVTIHFDRYGEKVLHLDYAKLEVVG